MKTFFLISFLFFNFPLFACQCIDFKEENINELKKKSDFIFVGTVVEQINTNQNKVLDLLWQRDNKSFDVLVVVEKIIKGKIKSDTIAITQITSGNCSRSFEKNKKYIFTGNQIKKIKNKSKNKFKNKNHPLVPYEKYKNKKVIIKNIEFDFKGWNKLIKKQKPKCNR